SMPNLEVKRCNADGSVGNPHVRVGHRQVLNKRRTPLRELSGVFFILLFIIYRINRITKVFIN
ncbi:hypothetical protein ACLSY0_07585, partial [Avibacterium avium]